MVKLTGKNLFQYTTRISFELSNRCNYAAVHQKCPLHWENEPVILPQKVVYSVLECMREYNFKGLIAFHIYNEPLIDPRLFLFLRKVTERLSQSEILIWTNGYYLNQVMVDELTAAGVTSLVVTAYSQTEWERINKLDVKIPLEVKQVVLDDRLAIYDKKPTVEDRTPCFAPLNDICITARAMVGLCCMDWKSSYSFGDLTQQSLDEILAQSEVFRIYRELSRGCRVYDICKVCGCMR